MNWSRWILESGAYVGVTSILNLSVTQYNKGLFFTQAYGQCPPAEETCSSWLLRGTGWCRLHLDQGFSTSARLTFGAGYLFVVGSCPLHCRILNNIPGLYKLDVNSIPPPHVVTFKTICRHFQMFPGEQNYPWLRIRLEWSGNALPQSDGRKKERKVEPEHWQLNASTWKWHTRFTFSLTKVGHMAISNFSEVGSTILSCEFCP